MIRNLSTHPATYVTVAELADYWAVSRQQIHKRIESGMLDAIRLGSRLYRIRTDAALAFERMAAVPRAAAEQPDTALPSSDLSRLPKRIGVRRIRNGTTGE